MLFYMFEMIFVLWGEDLIIEVLVRCMREEGEGVLFEVRGG